MQVIQDLLRIHLEKKLVTNEFSIQDITQLKSGWAGDIFSFNVTTNLNIQKKLILKIYSGTKNGVTSIEKECQALSRLSKEGYPVPELFSYDVSLNEFDKPFLIMDRIEGKLLWDTYVQGNSLQQVQHLSQFTKCLFQLHAIDVKAIQPDFVGTDPLSLIDHELEEIEQIIDQYKIYEVQELYQWLQCHKTSLTYIKPSILHRDYHPWNVLVDESGKLYVIDWVWGIGDYRFDLAWTITLMERSGFEQFATEVYGEYLSLMDGPIKDFDYFKVLATLRWILNVTVSVRSGENLRESDIENFRSFLIAPIEKANKMIQEITNINILVKL